MSGLLCEIAPAEAHLWLTFYDELVDERLFAACREVLSAEEQAQQARFYFERDRLRYLLTRALVRTVLSRYLPMSAEGWAFGTNAYGRPYIANAGFDSRDVRFNISHTHSLIALAVTRGREVGVDVENVQGRRAPIDIADHFFAPQETAALAEVSAPLQQDRFFEYWTFKESYIKARGMGLSLPLDRFSFRYPGPAAVELAVDPSLGDAAERWDFWQLRPAPQYLLALCAERLSTPVSRLIVRRTLPFETGERLDLPVLRASRRD